MKLKLGKIYQYRYSRRMFNIVDDLGWDLINEKVGRIMWDEPFVLLEVIKETSIAKVLSKKGTVGWIEYDLTEIREYSEKPWS